MMTNPNSLQKRFLRDGVYAYFDGWHIVIVADDNIVYLDSVTFDALVTYADYISDRTNGGYGMRWKKAASDDR